MACSAGEAAGWARPGILALLLLSLAALAVAPLGLDEGYSLVEHTTSESAAQGVDGAWVARGGLLLLGLAVAWLSLWMKHRWGPAGAVLFGTFGLSLVAAAVFAGRPWVDGAPYDRTEDLLHSVASSVTGVAFIAGAVSVGLRRTAPSARSLDFAAAFAAVGLSLGMLAWDGGQGALQRAMFLVAYAWFAKETLALGRDGNAS